MDTIRTHDFDNSDPALAVAPYDTFQALRDDCPVGWSEERGGFWVVSRYRDVHDIAMNPKDFSNAGNMTWPREFDPSASLRPVELDPPEHFLFRSLIMPSFSAGRLTSLEPLVRVWANELIDKFADRGECDLAQEFALPLPSYVIAHMLGLPRQDWEEFLSMATDFVRATMAQEEVDGVADPLEYGRAIWEARDEWRNDGLIELLLQAKVEGRPLTEAEFLGMFVVLVLGGQDTTQALISHSLLHLARFPADRQRLVENPGMIDTAVEELLRWVSPVHAGVRTAAVDTSVGSCSLRAGQKIVILWGAANTDDRVFADAERVVIDRKNNRHVAFGVGLHRCVGMHLARLEARVALQEILRRLPDYSVVEDNDVIRYNLGGMVRGIWSLSAKFTPAG